MFYLPLKSAMLVAADREPVTFQSAPFRCSGNRAFEAAVAVGRTEDPSARRTPATVSDPEIRTQERETQRCATAVAGTGARSQRCGGRGGEPTRATAAAISSNGEDEAASQASRTAGTSR